jgi:hypothetical protein
MPPTLVKPPRAPDSSEPFKDPDLVGEVTPSQAIPEVPGLDDPWEESSQDPYD